MQLKTDVQGFVTDLAVCEWFICHAEDKDLALERTGPTMECVPPHMLLSLPAKPEFLIDDNNHNDEMEGSVVISLNGKIHKRTFGPKQQRREWKTRERKVHPDLGVTVWISRISAGNRDHGHLIPRLTRHWSLLTARVRVQVADSSFRCPCEEEHLFNIYQG